MRILGVSLTNGYAALVVIEFEEDSWNVVDTIGTRKVELGDHRQAAALLGFSSAIKTFINSHRIDKIVIRRCSYRGQHRSGAGAIKMEALLQLMQQPVVLLAPQTIGAHIKQSNIRFPPGLNAYQREAFETAYCGISLG